MLAFLQVTDFEDLSALWSVGCCAAMLLWLIVWLYICMWVYRDAEARGSSGFLWAFLVLVFGIIPLIIWFIARPPLKQQAQHGYGYMPPPPVYNYCPICGQPLTFVPQYNRWYCNTCRAYQPEAQPQQVIITREVVKLPCSYCGMLNDSTQNQCSSCGARLLGK